MATVEITASTLTVRPSPLHVVLTLTRRVRVPLAAVRGATVDPGAVSEPLGVRVGGTRLPGLVAAGRFRRDGDRVFYDVHRRDRAVVVELEPGPAQPWRRLVVEVADPRATVTAVERALARYATRGDTSR